MRLTQLKLAGFKSFVDPTAIDVPGQLVGIVGPNGCGKSNLIDAVRWVLGESKASALRGDSMQDVIFSGSALRKPIARASVELIFDNSLGRAAGQWSQYGEIAVKRVLTRDGDSSYLINNLQVRRRDIHDIFLGTGLGPRAYAIIEQGMISRIIEAKPEELRVFLEEAAGVSKYRERRRETENRLADARENLTRVADILGELDAQIEKLAGQAEVAAQYRALQAELARQQHFFWLVKRNDATAERNRHSRELERVTNELEGEIAKLREAEKHLEASRSGQYAAQDALNAAQGAYYAANAEVQRLESEIRHVSENRVRIEHQVAQLRANRAQAEEHSARLAQDLEAWQGQSTAATAQVEAARGAADRARERVPLADERFRLASERRDAARNAATEVEQALQIEGAHHSHAEKALAGLQARHDRLLEEQSGMAAPDAGDIAARQEQAARLAQALQEADRAVDALHAEAGPLEAARKAAQDAFNAATAEVTGIEARIAALRQLQQSVRANATLAPWLAKHGLDAMQRLWQRLRVGAGWENALEAVLRERLNGIEVRDLTLLAPFFDDAPPAKLTFFAPAAAPSRPPAAVPGLRALREFVAPADAALAPVLDDWLDGVFIAGDAAAALAARSSLPPGGMLVTQDGHVVAAQAVSFFAADSEQHGLLARQNEIDGLSAAATAKRDEAEAARAALARAEAAWQQNRTGHAVQAKAATGMRATLHQAQLEVLRLTQIAERFHARSGQIQAELDEIAGHLALERENKARAETNFERYDAELGRLQEEFEALREAHELAEAELAAARKAVQDAEHAAQEAAFQERQCALKIEEIRRQQEANRSLAEQQAAQVRAAEAELATLEANPHAAELQAALAARVACEQELAARRADLEGRVDALRELEAKRGESEHRLDPLRERINEVRLKEQAAQIACDQFAAQLAEARVDVDALAAQLERTMRAGALQNQINALNEQIGALGAVNLAALEELEAARDRRGFLDRQSADLGEAIETLETAIRRIDRESRALLQETFDAVNGHFGQLFPKLFGGGEAKLVMSGEEILDAGVQVMAQPPGKKTTTIHLLSGGEKALAALALVFAIFQLNPAPFCLLDEVDAPLDDTNTERFCDMVKEMSQVTQFVFISHNKISMEMAHQLIGVTMQESGVSRVVAVDIEEAVRMKGAAELAAAAGGGPRAATVPA